MTFYWPMAITDEGKVLFTYDSTCSEAECVAQFKIWENHYKYKIKEAWIEYNQKINGITHKIKRRVYKEWIVDTEYVVGEVVK